ncbi:MAG: succinylglutamate desuccinylase/aspartoacylase family protein, partial [Firmicutes bacterium]|nr:succinylglutamate desuccinylase/aspartoacylase family protein [Bacillota bacterium]
MKSQIITIANVSLPVDETLKIRKHRLIGDNIENSKRISIVTGIHGDELEGQYVCYELSKRICEESKNLKGIVDIYPAMNPFGIDSITRGIPAFDLDMNRIFPGNNNGDMNEYIAAEIVKDMVGTDLCLDIHASNIFLTEVPQIRINALHKDTLVPIA